MSDRNHLPTIIQPSQMPAGYAALPQQYASPGISLAQLWTILWAYRRFSLGVIVGALVIAIAVAQLLPKSYTATATLMVDYEVNDPLGGREFPVGLMGSYMSTQIQLIKSPAVLTPVIDKMALTRDKHYSGGFSGDATMLQEWVRDQFIKRLTVEQGEWGSQLIYITYSAPSALQAAEAANTVADVYAEQQFLRLTGPASERQARYSAQLEELKAKVDQAQQKLIDYRQKAGLVETDGKADIDMTRLGSLESQLLSAQEARRSAESRMVGEASTRDSVLGANSIQTLKGELAAQRTQLAQLSTTLGTRHPEVLQLQSQMEATQRSLESEMATYSGNSQTQIGAARALENQLVAAVAAEHARALSLRKTLDEASTFERDLQAAQTLYSKALNGFESTGTGGGYNNVHFVSRASPPVKASKPKPMMYIALAIILGGLVGVAGPLAYELFNRRIRCRDDLDRDFGIPVLAEFGSTPMHGALA
ncbi:MAG: chain-length determining protein [Hydrocarboniphaga sp.]|uniref:GumC family protein n=1 Tax=Hydrocarboniphaga sp. TaxID=2033016 RepID=UPI0026239AD8|nr:Wzz/FepE/Etk N-terminal domain-containing protein [Hydrocarboniphaga sp.]MDB5969099.1 chain-length determining protein [Hydrocarboniphaga sp.]